MRPTIPLFIILLIVPSLSFALTGKVISIADGDTITILDSSKKQHKIRLYGIDCPEKGQPFGKAAKKHTAKLTARKMATVTEYDTDRYGRTVGVVQVDGVNVNENLIKAGLAWQYKKYCRAAFCKDWLQKEKEAAISQVGLWRDSDPVPPWQWRKGARNSSYSKNTTVRYAATSDGYHANVKSHVFHGPGCKHYNCKNCTQSFSGRSAALKAGYRPCGRCKP